MATALLSFQDSIQDPTADRLPRALWYCGALFVTHLTAADTNGACALIEVTGRPGIEPPLHTHRNEDEMFYVLKGQLTVTRGNETIVVQAGESAFLPRGVAHTFKISSSEARWLVYITPGGFEDFFAALGKPAAELAIPEKPEFPGVERMVQLAQQFGLTFSK